MVDHVFVELDAAEIKSKQRRFAGAEKVASITKTMSLHFDDRHGAYILVKDGTPIGWLELDKNVELFGKTYSTIKMIFLLPELRKTMAAGAFLVALKNHMQYPLILGSDEYGGVLFSDGAHLVKALNKSSRNFVQLLDLKTGEKKDLVGEVPSRPSHLTLIFESSEFPLWHEGAGVYIFEGCEMRPFTEDGSL